MRNGALPDGGGLNGLEQFIAFIAMMVTIVSHLGCSGVRRVCITDRSKLKRMALRWP
jgi:hypothetical protein